jgi:hypothetical protein
MKHILFIFATVLILSGCNSQKQSENSRFDDSVMTLVKANRQLIASIQEANALLDSIYHFTSDEKNNEEHQESMQLISNLKQLQESVKTQEVKLAKVEKALRVSRNEADAYLLMVLAYQGEVQLRDEVLKIMTDSIEKGNTISSARIVSTTGM